MLSKLSKNKGFTLIEVVIVLAIAALIILVVFNAIGAAQQSSRDNTRKQEAGQLASQLEQFASNNNGVYPATLAAVGASYDTKGLVTGTAPKYSSVAACPADVTATTYNLIYTGGGTRSYSLSVCVEGGDDTVQVAP